MAKAVSKLTKDECLDELASLQDAGVEFEDEFGEDSSVTELRSLVAEGREALAEGEDEASDDETADDESDEESEEVAEEGVAPGKGAHVFTADGRHVRSYTERIHGKEYAALAKEFAGKHDGYVVKVKK